MKSQESEEKNMNGLRPSSDGVITVSADRFTKTSLDIDDTISEDKARKIVENLSQNNNYKVALGDNKLIIQRFLRD